MRYMNNTKTASDMTQQYYTVLDVAKVVQLTPQTIRSRIKEGRLKAEKIGRALMIRKADLDEFIRAERL